MKAIPQGQSNSVTESWMYFVFLISWLAYSKFRLCHFFYGHPKEAVASLQQRIAHLENVTWLT